MAVSDNIQMNIAGDVRGQIAIGDNIMQIQNNGGVVYVVQQKQTKFEKMPRPVQRRPRAYPNLLDRVSETSGVRSSISSNLSVSVFGENGVGKTTFLNHMAHLPETEDFADGIVHLYVKNLGLDDLLQVIFDAFYASPDGVIPTIGQLRHRLQSLEVVILLDELTLGREDTQALLSIMPASLFLIVSTEQSLWGEGKAIELRGLPEKESLDLFAQEIGRDLSQEEIPDAKIICNQLGRHPLKIIHAASLVRSENKIIAEIKSQFQKEEAALVVDNELFDNMDDEQKKVLAVLGAGNGALFPLGIITSIVKLPNAQSILEGFVSSGVVWMQGSQYAIYDEVMAIAGNIWDLKPWRDSLVNYFSEWIVQGPEDRLIEEATNLLLQVVQYAGEQNRWPEVIRIGKEVERILILQKRWQAWLNILELILNAAKAYGDRSTEAWVLHQMGSRAMCLNYSDQAREFLTQALNLRQAIGDKAGMAVTQHNLSSLPGVPAPVNAGKGEKGSGCRRFVTCGAIGVIGLGVLIMIGVLILFNLPSFTPPPTSTRVPTRTITPSYTPTDTVTSSYTPTDTPTLTPSRTPTKTPTPSFTPSHTPTKTKPPTITPDNIGPPAPNLVEPAYDSFSVSSSGTIWYEINCINDDEDVVLDWFSVSDPSGISNYRVELRHYNSNVSEWETAQTWNVVDSTELNVNYITDCGEAYNWRVRARDGAGNFGSWSVRQYLELKKVVPGPD